MQDLKKIGIPALILLIIIYIIKDEQLYSTISVGSGLLGLGSLLDDDDKLAIVSSILSIVSFLGGFFISD